MSKAEIKYNWNGEKVTQIITEEKKDLTPKEILNGIDSINGQINKAKSDKDNLKAQSLKVAQGIEDLNKALKQLKPFEEKCQELQMEKAARIISEISPELIKKAKADADEIIAKDPETYSEEQKKLMPYHNFQKLLATHEKFANKIANRIMRSVIYENPIYKNPFV